ncbi:MAG: TonB-dependent receptor, partial [Caulobacterales bacterium]|nr:TonB-dependent receptor [Caulobacterales bacterium]
LQLTGGVRYTDDSKRASVFNTLFSQNAVLPTPTLLLPTTFSATGGVGGQVSVADEFSGLTYRVVGSYRLNENTNLWASYARGRRPEVLNVASALIDPDGSLPTPSGDEFEALAIPEIIDDEIVDSFEVGGYAELFDGALTVNGSVYYYQYENFQLNFLSQGRAEVINGGDASGPGVEGAATVRLNDFAELFGTYAYTGVRFDGGSGDTADRGLDLDDARFRLAPDHQVSLGGRFTYPVTTIGEAFFTPTYTYKSEIFFENGDPDFLFNGVNIPLSQEGYGLLNLRAGLVAPDQRWAVEVFARNALDEEYIIDAGNTGLSFGSPTFVAGPPRLVGASVSGRF